MTYSGSICVVESDEINNIFPLLSAHQFLLLLWRNEQKVIVDCRVARFLDGHFTRLWTGFKVFSYGYNELSSTSLSPSSIKSNPSELERKGIALYGGGE